MRGLYEGKKMGGTDGVFGPMLKHLLESMLEGELDHHLQDSFVQMTKALEFGNQDTLELDF